MHTSPIGGIESVEGTIEELLGVQSASLVGTTAIDLVDLDDQNAALGIFAEAIREPGRAISAQHRLRRPDGTTLWVESTLLLTPPRSHPSGPADDSTLVVLVVDATERRAQEAALQASREEARGLAEEFRLLAEEVPSGVFRADIGGNVQFANSHFVDLAGGRPVANLADLAHPGDRDRVEAARAAAIRHHDDGRPGDDTVTVEFRSALPDGGSRSLRVRAPRSGSGAPSGLIGVFTDSTPTARLREEARTDPLTGLRNRTALDDHIETAIGAGREVAVMFIDLDRFKEVNDAHGHHAGDAVLQVVAKRLRGCTRPTEMVTRYGGDEFVIVSTDPAPDILENLTGRVHGVLDHPIRVDGLLWQPSASLGLALSEPGDGPADVLHRADHEMYQAKQRRRRPASS
nr:diguanylate cyclase [Rhabdothermincola salaria]